MGLVLRNMNTVDSDSRAEMKGGMVYSHVAMPSPLQWSIHGAMPTHPPMLKATPTTRSSRDTAILKLGLGQSLINPNPTNQGFETHYGS